MPTEHAKISPSSFARVRACPASLHFAAQFPDEESEAARIGTACHEALERLLDGELIEPGFIAENGIRITAEHMAHVDEALEWILDQGFDRVFTEVRLPIGHALGLNDPDAMWGTSDVIGIKGSALYVIDAKFGFVPVHPKGNSQAMCYLVGALRYIEDNPRIGQIDEWWSVILQPRAGGVKQHRITSEEIRAFRQDAVEAITLANSADAPFIPGDDQCRFCPAAGSCKAQILSEFHDLDHVDTDKLSNEELSEWLDKADHIISTVKAMQSAALSRLAAGQTIPGWKRVTGSSKARWIDEEEVLEEIKAAGLDLDVYAPRKPTTQTALRASKALGAETVEALVMRPEGQPKLARVEDPGDPLDAEFVPLD